MKAGRPPARRRRFRMLVAAAALAAAAAAAAAPLARLSPGASADSATAWSVTVAPATDLADGQGVAVTVKTTSAFPIYSAEAHVCRAGVNYQPSSGLRPADDFTLGGPNCPPKPVSTSADVSAVDSSTYSNAVRPQGETFPFRIGVGVVDWTSNDQTTHELTCDPTNPCDLVVELNGGSPAVSWVPFVQPITFHNDDPIAGCGGPAIGILTTGGSDRMADSWVNWTLGECALPGRHGAAGRAVFSGEGQAVSSFAGGNLDLAYTSLGYNRAAGLAGTDPNRRAAVAVPLAINATVLAVGGGYRLDDGSKVPYSDIRLTTDEVAALISGGAAGIEPHYPDIFARNPQLQRTGFFDTSAGIKVGAAADGEATSWLATRFLAQLVPASWRVPDVPLFGADRGKARGVDAALALASPSYSDTLNLLSGRPALQKGLQGPGPTTSGGVWVLTDLETATALHLTPVQIGNAAGRFVAPTTESIMAAMPTMKPDENGVLVSDPAATAPSASVQPYPLVQVEYALAPAEPLLNEDCSPRTASQALLKSWLSYVVGAGQKQLPAGLLPLTPALQAQAVAAAAKVGASPVTGDCASRPAAATTAAAIPAPTAPAVPEPVPDVQPPPPPAASTPYVATRPPRVAAPVVQAAVAPPPAPPPTDATPQLAPAQLVAIPAFAGRRASSPASAVVSLAGIAVLASLAAIAASGRFSR